MTDLVPSPQELETVSGITAVLDRAEEWLDQNEHIEDIVEIRRTTAGIERLCQTIDDARDVMQRASLIRVRAERLAGQWLSDNLQRGGSWSSGSTLTDLQITKNQSSSWQLIAKIPDEKFDVFIDDKVAKGYDVTTSGLIAYARNVTGWNPPTSRVRDERKIQGIHTVSMYPHPDRCALEGFEVECTYQFPMTNEHIIRKSAYQGGSAELKQYYERSMNKARTCVMHNVGKWADAPIAVKFLVLQKCFKYPLDDVRDYFNSAPWKVFPHEWTFEGMLSVRPKIGR